MRILVTGATGYIGGRLAPRLVDAGHEVRVLVRDAARVRDVPWAKRVEVVTGDLSDAATLPAAFEGIDVAYYLVHAMGAGGDFERTELTSARNVAAAAKTAGVKRIVYLGGLHPDVPLAQLSTHLRSRAEVGEILIASGVPTAALQAGTVIGSGSASFEMIRHLTEVLPYMPAPKWVRNFIQPIAVRDVLYYLVAAASLPAEVNRTFDIGGPDVLRYGQMMNGYALEAGLRQRPIASLPVLTPWLASQWVNLVTPIPRQLAVPIIASLQYDCVASEHDIAHYIPDPEGGLTGYRKAVRLALACILARGHLLIEDIPGVGKTTLAHVLARLLGLQFQRIQFTSDMLPADIIGVSIFDQRDASFRFHPGPVFAQLLLADEINRATPKTQSALLEAMQEGQATVEGDTRPLPQPFVVLATQNPIEYEGTFPLPEAQVDRFLVRVRFGYPEPPQEEEILRRRIAREREEVSLPAVTGPEEVLALRQALEEVYVDPDLLGYMVALVAATRRHPSLAVGASPRGTLALLKISRARAALAGRDYVLPDDVKAVAGPALAHRLILSPELWTRDIRAEDIIADILAQTPVPKAG